MFNFSEEDYYWMSYSLMLSRRSRSINEIPVGAVIIFNKKKLISEGWNQSILTNDVTSHAEIIAIRKANLLVNNYRLSNNFSIYVTLEPCIMCLGAIMHSRINNLYYGADNNSIFSCINYLKKINFLKLNIYSGLLNKECINELNNFFYCCRLKNKF